MCGKKIVVTAPTNLVACLINGQTWQGAFSHSDRSAKGDGQPADLTTLQAAWSQVMLLIIDEVSMLGAGDLHVIDSKLKLIFSKQTRLGVTGVLFGGDMRQLAPVKRVQLYQYSRYKGLRKLYS